MNKLQKKKWSTKKLTTEDFIQKANIIHNCFYDYPKVLYLTSHTKIIVTCREHGDFLVSPNNHLKGRGCPRCKNVKLKLERIFDIKQFIDKAKTIHGNVYGYDNFIYKGYHTKSKIRCGKHGFFKQRPSVHLRGGGCPKCANEINGNLIRYTLEEIIQKFIITHGYKYDYSKVIYKDIHTKVTIICPVHGEFEQTPNSHLRGCACPYCDESKGERLIATILDKHNIKYIREFKIPGTTYRFKYDFYLSDLNILIEFHGEQHYKSIKHFGGIEGLKYRQKNDMFKKELAQLAKIPLIEINYKHFKELDKDKFTQLLISSIIN